MLACSLRRRNIYTISTGSDKVKAVHDWPRPKIEKSEPPDFPKTVGPDRQKCSRTDDFKIYIGPNVR